MTNHFDKVCGRLRHVLLRCKAFASDRDLHAVFQHARILSYIDAVPQMRTREQRVDWVIANLRQQYTSRRENTLALCLEALSEYIEPGDALHWQLTELAHQVAQAAQHDSLNPFRQALRNIAYEDANLYPLAGQVRAGTGSVALNYINELTPGERYLLAVIGSSMEYEGIFEGDHVLMRAFVASEWPRPGDLIVTKYLPYELCRDGIIDVADDDLAGPTLKFFHQKVGGEFYLGWRKDNKSWGQKFRSAVHMPGNKQGILTKYIVPIGKVIEVKHQRVWSFPVEDDTLILGDER